MSRSTLAIVLLFAFVAGAGAGVVIARKGGIQPDTYEGKTPEQAAGALLEIAAEEAEGGSWETIHLARVYFLSGNEGRARELINSVLESPKAEAGDWIRAGRVYEQAGLWDEARRAFDKVVEMKPKDEDWLAEIGAYYNLHGDRTRAEQLFTRSFALGTSLNNVLDVAGSYVGVTPRQR